MSKKSNNDSQTPEQQNKPSRGASAGRKVLRVFGRAIDFTIDFTAGSIVTVFKAIGTILLILLVTGMMFACVFAYYVKTCLTPNLDLSLEDFKLNESSTVWYRDGGGEWRELVNLSGREKRVWVNYEDIPWYMEKALVAIEDKRFYDHKGVDWYRTFGAFVEMFARMQTSYGGSTITQQLIKNLTGEDEVTIQRKLTEIFGALELEKKYDKQEIMEWYLNAVYFGEGCYGVQTAAQTYFGKDVSDLTIAESAAIVGITNLPTYYDPFYNEENNKKRQETILREMYEQEYIDYDTYRAACAEQLVFKRSPGIESVV
ncbi:MAG: transglycosylase domain-containing protein, partial [Oscillospiraceae bacterium]|nr:transglycosylase domain-containing protein [Oscillospiraceae bacterium]